MARLPRVCPAGVPEHVIQRGNNRQQCFADQQDYRAYIGWLKDYSQEHDVQIHAWVLMTNHVHLLCTPADELAVAKMMQCLGRKYVRYFNHRHQRTGTLWEGRYKSCLVQTEIYLLNLYRYIELNPVRAMIVDTPAEYPWSSYQINALGKQSTLCTPHQVYLALGSSKGQRLACYRTLFSNQIGPILLKQIREAINRGTAIGSNAFKQQMETKTGRRMLPARMGRPAKSASGAEPGKSLL
ncbi:transposase [Lacimicrobium alkaliphilum]|uniref:Transposase n=1 Tax=Lacimicrobium alkaliphilum TaxID=1526571 RepID=A0A0U2QQ05_9ALTE|nr:transposase [Lacimicrobium alkaliphilum]ALS99755.1 transposase [Lacimicrobium alkaliphilum]